MRQTSQRPHRASKATKATKFIRVHNTGLQRKSGKFLENFPVLTISTSFLGSGLTLTSQILISTIYICFNNKCFVYL